ncbi:MAG: hypothetical protein LLG37_10165 [Spirochaetia bacterium]|nr:hypothetical protein [Spirochaetia bacterium]
MKFSRAILLLILFIFFIFSPLFSATDTPTETPCPCPDYFGRTYTLTAGTTAADGIFDSNSFTLTEDAVVRTLSINIDSTTAGGQVRLAIYTNDSAYNVPAALIAETAPQTAVTGWNTLDIPDTTLTAGKYWIAYQAEAGITLAYDTGINGEEAWFDMGFGYFPATIATGNLWNWQYGLRADYCPVICTTPTNTPTYTLTPTPIGTCMCGDEFGTVYQLSGSIPVNGFMVANWYGITEDAAATSMDLYVVSGSGNARCAIYANSVTGTVAGQPGNLLVESAPFAVSAGWNTVTIPQTTLYAYNVYWLAYQTDSAAIYTAAEAGSTGSLYWQPLAFGPFPGIMSPGGSEAEDHSINVNYCPLSCPQTPTQTPAAESPTETITPTQVLSITPTVTGTAEASYTHTPDITATNSSTLTATGTFTVTVTLTASPTDVFSQTMTTTATFTPVQSATTTETPTAEATTTNIELTGINTYPNPYNGRGSGLTIRYHSTRNISGMSVKFYTLAMRLVMKYEDTTPRGAGDGCLIVDKSRFETLSNGAFYYVLEAKADNNSTAVINIKTLIFIR